jgi:hypothetical protein
MNAAAPRPPRMTDKDMIALGVSNIAYVKPVIINQVKAYAIHTADGVEVTTVPSQELADVVIRQNDLEPVRVH